MGRVAKEMLVVLPTRSKRFAPSGWVIADFEITEAMLKYFINRVNGPLFFSPRVVIAVPSGITAVERAVYNSAERAGARKVYLVEEPRAAGLSRIAD